MTLIRTLIFAMLLAGLSAQAQDHQRPFQFTPPDEKLRAEANEIDAQYEKKGLIYQDPKSESFLHGIGLRLTGSASPPDGIIYRFRILQDPMINAFALPNGSIYVNSGLVAAMQNESQLAAVMAHEITHVVNRHAYIQNRSVRKKAVAMDVIAIAAAGAGYFPIGAAFGCSVAFAGQFSQVLIVATVFGYSRELESDADSAGYGRLIRADYDGAAMAGSFELLDERLEFEPTEPFWRTHPKLKGRIATAGKLAQAENTAHPRVTPENEYLGHVNAVVRYNITLDLESRRARTAVDRAQRLVKWNPDAVNRTLLADAYRALGAKTSKPDQEELSKHGKDIARKQILKLTSAEEQRSLLSTEAGKAIMAENQAKAEQLYKEAIVADPHLPDPHRGLGMQYQDEGKHTDAAREYRQYLDLASPRAVDRLRIERRLEALTNATEKK
jgi:predicted Zn-dependent protease